ncbi:hypothetical protein Hanom_Chr08g00732861 [Helianthus anomalus]
MRVLVAMCRRLGFLRSRDQDAQTREVSAGVNNWAWAPRPQACY